LQSSLQKCYGHIRKNAQTLEYQKECTDPGISERMHRPWNIRKNAQTLEYQKEFTDPVNVVIFYTVKPNHLIGSVELEDIFLISNIKNNPMFT
jgi:hypothetical protein